MPRSLAVLCAALVAALAVPSASAHADEFGYPSQQPLTNGRVIEAVRDAEAWWPQHSAVKPCPNGVEMYSADASVFADRVDGAAAWGLGYHSIDDQECAGWLSPDLLTTVRSGDGYRILEACEAITHEVGHALGKPHTKRGVMAGEQDDGTMPDTEPYAGAWAPSFCLGWTYGVLRDQLHAAGIHLRVNLAADLPAVVRSWARRHVPGGQKLMRTCFRHGQDTECTA